MRLIDADALHELIYYGYDLNFDEVPETKRELLRMVDEQETIDAVPLKHGEWLETEQPCGWTDVSCATCSVCGEDYVLGEMCMEDVRYGFKYCPNCGAKMDERNNDATN